MKIERNARSYPLLSGAVDDDAHWRSLPAAQQPAWPDPVALRRNLAFLSAAPGLVCAAECDRLRERLATAARGEAFLLQAGDCAETFARLTPDRIAAQVGMLTDLAGVLSGALRKPVVTVGRIAGQYAKPRSEPDETRDGLTLPSYRGDAVNGLDFTPSSRTPDPARLYLMYRAVAVTLEVIRACPGGGEVFTSHEALLLDYEHSLARTRNAASHNGASHNGASHNGASHNGGRYGLSGHLLWIGERTRQLDGAHVDFASRVRNPIGVKLGPTTTAAQVRALIGRLDPGREPGRLTFIARMGAEQVRGTLPELVAEAAACEAPVLWVCDPMHGNTRRAPSGHKTRFFDDILAEVAGFFEVHRTLGTHPGGVHLELTIDPVTECVGGTGGPALTDVSTRYETACDPRLNDRQAAELVAAIADIAGSADRAEAGTARHAGLERVPGQLHQQVAVVGPQVNGALVTETRLDVRA
jgi:3-deoxy-7-phosphoheptulonate synthase